jgi:hypothetical protein
MAMYDDLANTAKNRQHSEDKKQLFVSNVNRDSRVAVSKFPVSQI